MTDQLTRIEAKLDRLINGPQPEILGAREGMKLLGCRTYSAFYRRIKELGVKPVMYGKYRRVDFTNALARRALGFAQPPAKTTP